MVYGIIHRHGGTIEIASEKGKGTTFSLLLPATDQMAAPSGTDEQSAVNRTLSILVVDDQEIICELIAEYLRADGHEVTLAFDGNSALEKFRAGDFQLVVTDQSMPGINCTQLGTLIKADRPATPVILLTGFGDEMQASGKSPEGIDLVVSKPVSHADLRRAVARAIAAKPIQAA